MANNNVPSDLNPDQIIYANTYTNVEDITHVYLCKYLTKVTPEVYNSGQLNLVALDLITEGHFKLNSYPSQNLYFNNILLVNDNNELLGTRYISGSLLNLQEISELNVYINVYDNEVSTPIIEVNYTTHITSASSDIDSVHPYAKNHLATNTNERVGRIGTYINPSSISKNIIQVVSQDSNRIDGKVQVVPNNPNMVVNRGRKYSYFQRYYLDYDAINSAYPTFSASGRKWWLGFNSKYGSYLYTYFIENNYLIVGIVGSNGRQVIEIIKSQIPSGVDLNVITGMYKLNINRWYDRLYFIVNEKCWSIQWDRATNPPIITSHSDGDLLYTCELHTVGTQITQILNEYSLMMTDFSDIGDVLINTDLNSEEGASSRYVNIFEDTSPRFIKSGSSYIDYKVMNTYDIDNRDKLGVIFESYNISLDHYTYIKNKNEYTIIYLGSAYTVARHNKYGTLLVLFKAPRKVGDIVLTRCVHKLNYDDVHVIADNYIAMTDGTYHNIWGDNNAVAPSYLSLIGRTLIDYNRGVVVLKDNLDKGAYRYVGN